jgi:hypothetical protein
VVYPPFTKSAILEIFAACIFKKLNLVGIAAWFESPLQNNLFIFVSYEIGHHARLWTLLSHHSPQPRAVNASPVFPFRFEHPGTRFRVVAARHHRIAASS